MGPGRVVCPWHCFSGRHLNTHLISTQFLESFGVMLPTKKAKREKNSIMGSGRVLRSCNYQHIIFQTNTLIVFKLRFK